LPDVQGGKKKYSKKKKKNSGAQLGDAMDEGKGKQKGVKKSSELGK